MPARSSRFLRCAALVIIVCSIVGLRSAAAADGKRSFFLVVPHATDIKQSQFQGHDQLVYQVDSEYPPAEILKIIGTRLKALGWKPLKHDWLNPDIPSSLIRGWSFYEDLSTNPSTTVRSWKVDWTNQNGDLLTYILEYRCPGKLCSSTYDLHNLRVMEIHLSAKVADQIRRSIPKQ